MPLVLLVVLRDLRLALLEYFDFETSLSGPLLAQVLIELLNGLVLQLLDLGLDFMAIVDFL